MRNERNRPAGPSSLAAYQTGRANDSFGRAIEHPTRDINLDFAPRHAPAADRGILARQGTGGTDAVVVGRINSIPNVSLVALQSVFGQQPAEFILKTLGAMVLFLIRNVRSQRLDVPGADGECTETVLPIEFRERWRLRAYKHKPPRRREPAMCELHCREI